MAVIALVAVAVFVFVGALWIICNDDEIKLCAPRSPEDTLLEGLRIRYLNGVLTLDEFEYHVERAIREHHDPSDFGYRARYGEGGSYFATLVREQLATTNELRGAIFDLPPLETELR